MEPWIHPLERRIRIILVIKNDPVSVAAVTIPFVLVVLQEPTKDHLILSSAVPIICVVGVLLNIRALKKLPEQFRTEEETDSTASRNDKPKVS